jgi:hypothetical protein
MKSGINLSSTQWKDLQEKFKGITGGEDGAK